MLTGRATNTIVSGQRHRNQLRTVLRVNSYPKADMVKVCWIVLEHEAIANNQLLVGLVSIIRVHFASLYACNKASPLFRCITVRLSILYMIS